MCKRASLAIVVTYLIFASITLSTANAEIKVYFGNLHAHSRLSDGNHGISPSEAYRIAREEGGLDFLSLSEHNHMLSHQEMKTLIRAAEEATRDDFVALFGQEYSTITTGYNHTNIQNYPLAISHTHNGKYGYVFGKLLPDYLLDHPETIVFAGFNHPEDIDEDYGLGVDYDGDWGRFVADLDPIVQLIAISNGPSDYDRKSYKPPADKKFLHRDVSTSRWFDYLSHGMHLAPKIDHDTHSPTYGSRVAGRTAVWVDDSFTRSGLLAALSGRHCYATEDSNLRIIAKVDESSLPGDIIARQDEEPLDVAISISDDDEPKADYTIEVYSGIAGDGHRPRKVTPLTAHQTGNGTAAMSIPVENDVPLYFVIHVEQKSGDPVNGSEMDDAWLAPIWIQGLTEDDSAEQSAVYISSVNSKVYHYPECRVVHSIKKKNRQYHEEAPEGKTLHKGCPW